MKVDVFELLVVGWCSSCLLAVIGLVVWAVVELKQLATTHFARMRAGADFPRARSIEKDANHKAPGR